MIYIEPCGGLGNRMRAIDSAIRLAKFKNTGVIVFWKVNEDLGAPFEALFEPFPAGANVVKVVNIARLDYPGYIYDSYFKGIRRFSKPLLIDNPDWEFEQISHEYIRLFLASLNGTNLYDREMDQYVQKTWQSLWPEKSYYIRSYSRFFGTPFSTYQHFVPIASIRRKATKLIVECGNFSCGIHIRRTDQISAVEKSTTEKFVTLMKEELAINSGSKFFLATDSEDEKQKIRHLFRESIVTADIIQGRGQAEAMEDALMELYVLAHMRKIIGSYWSSFTLTAVSYLNYLKPYSIVK